MRRVVQVAVALIAVTAVGAFLYYSEAPDLNGVRGLAAAYPSTTYALAAGFFGLLAGALYWPPGLRQGWAWAALLAWPVFAVCAFGTHLTTPTDSALVATLRTLGVVGHSLPWAAALPACGLGRLLWSGKQ